MDQELDDMFGFAPDYNSPVPYMHRTREYYKAIGYTTPYRWAHYLQAPFAPLKKPLSHCNVAIVTTAAPYQPGKGDQGPGAAYNGSAKFYQVYSGDTDQEHDLRISHIGYDRIHTTATDSNTWFPLPALRRAEAAGRIGRVARALPWRADQPQPSGHHRNGCAGNPGASARRRRGRGHRRAELPGLPPDIASSRAMSRPTVSRPSSWGARRTSSSTPPSARFLFSDFPLGNSAGKPHDVASQQRIWRYALRLLEFGGGTSDDHAKSPSVE